MISQIILDLDGVLVDFIDGAYEFFQMSRVDYPPNRWGFMDDWPDMTPNAFWTHLNDSDFWANLNWTPDGKAILKVCEKAVGRANVCICTSPGGSIAPECSKGKFEWIAEHMPRYTNQTLVGASKQFLANATSVLIDDGSHNIGAFKARGGHGILVPQEWNGGNEIDVPRYISDQLKDLI